MLQVVMDRVQFHPLLMRHENLALELRRHWAKLSPYVPISSFVHIISKNSLLLVNEFIRFSSHSHIEFRVLVVMKPIWNFLLGLLDSLWRKRFVHVSFLKRTALVLPVSDQ